MTIYLIRHSITDANSASCGYAIMCGSTQAHVTEAGKELAARTGKEYDFSGDLDKVTDLYCSTLDRTVETANSMFPEYIEKFNLHRCSEFDEVDFGDYEMVPKLELPEELLKLWDDNPAELAFPGGDSMKERAVRGVEKLISICEESDSDTPIIVISSSTLLRLMLTIIRNIPLNEFHGIPMENCNVVKLKYAGNGEFLDVD